MQFNSVLKACVLGAAIVSTTGAAVAQELRKVSMSLAGQSMIASIPRFANCSRASFSDLALITSDHGTMLFFVYADCCILPMYLFLMCF